MSVNAGGGNVSQSLLLVTSKKFPTQKSEELEPVLSKAWVDTAQAVNARTIGIFNTNAITIGDKYYSTSTTDASQLRQAYRKLFTFGTIAAGATLTITHGITNITEIVHLYGNCITDVSVVALANAKYEPLPFVSTTLNEQVSIYMNDTIITIVNGAGNNNILSGTIITEYLLS